MFFYILTELSYLNKPLTTCKEVFVSEDQVQCGLGGCEVAVPVLVLVPDQRVRNGHIEL